MVDYIVLLKCILKKTERGGRGVIKVLGSAYDPLILRSIEPGFA